MLGNEEQRQAELAKQALEEQRKQQLLDEEKRKQQIELKAEEEVAAVAVSNDATVPEPVPVQPSPAPEAQPEVPAVEAPAPAKPVEMTEEQRLEEEKKQRLEAAVQRTAEKVKKKAEAKQQQTLHKKKAEFKPSRGPTPDVEVGGGDARRGKAKKAKPAPRREKPEFEIDLHQVGISSKNRKPPPFTMSRFRKPLWCPIWRRR